MHNYVRQLAVPAQDSHRVGWVCCHSSPCGIFGGESCIGMGIFSDQWVLACRLCFSGWMMVSVRQFLELHITWLAHHTAVPRQWQF